jgi:hypothetical protein
MLSRLMLRVLSRLVVGTIVTGVRVGTAFARASGPDHYTCQVCGYEIPTIGLFQCACGFASFGDYWAPCQNCDQSPGFVTCSRCAQSNLNPFI